MFEKGKAWAKFGAFRSELTDRRVPLHLRLRLFDAVITPTALYACEAWTMTQSRQQKLRTAQRRMDHRSNEASTEDYGRIWNQVVDGDAAREDMAVGFKAGAQSWPEMGA